MAIHCVERERKRYIRSGRHATTTEAASSTMFLSSVCTLVRRNASPKQPQSFTGLNSAIHTVMRVITAMNATRIFDTRWRRMANKTNTPRLNSSADSATDARSVTMSGTMPPVPTAEI